MKKHVLNGLVGGLIAYALFCPTNAHARGIILITSGERLTAIGDAAPSVKSMLGTKQIGYKYGYWGIFWVDLWTHSGTYCVFEGDRYQRISAAEAAQLLGKRESELGPPILYTVPLGWMLIVPVIGVWLILSAQEKKKQNRIAALFQDSRYQGALKVLDDHYQKHSGAAASAPAEATPPPTATPSDAATATPSDAAAETGGELEQPSAVAPPAEVAQPSTTAADDENRFHDAFDAGVQHLFALGVPREEAARNLSTMVQILNQAHQQ
jgi:hypothetical protein